MSSKKPLAKPVSTQKTDLAALRKASKLPLANPDKQEEEKLLSDVAAEEAQDTPVQLAAAPGTVVSDASPAGAHSVGDAHAAHAAQPAAQASGMGALSSNWLLGAAGFGLVAAAASGGGGGGSSPAATPTPSQQGTAIDGYVVGADVYLDTNNNHQLDAGDTKVGTTGKGGSFSVSNPNKLDVFVKGGFNDSNQNGTKDAGELDNTVVLKATGGTSGNFIVSPLTTLVQELLRQSPQTTQKAAESTIKAALGLDQAIDLTTFDPLAAGNTANALAAYKAAVQVATALDIAADEQAFLQALVSKLTANTTPGASGILVSSITAAFTGSTDNNVTSTELLNKLELIGSATSIGNITESQAQVNNDKEVTKPVFTLNSDTGSSQTDNITSDKVVKVTLAADVANWEYSLKGGEWTKGTGTTFNLADNATYAAGDIQVRQTDKAGNISDIASNKNIITVDTTVAAPTFALRNDSGVSAEGMEGTVTDGITSDNVVVVSNLEQGATWQYSLDGGKTWNNGEGSDFSLKDNTTYLVGDIKVRQTDKAGNTSQITSNEAQIQEDSTVAAPSFALRTDSGAQGDGLTNDPVINVTLADDVAVWGYVLDGSTEYIRGTGTSFTLDPNTTYAPGQIRVIQADKAGNISVVFSNEAAITVDTTVGLPTVRLHDTGISDSDYITKDNVVTVTPADDVDFWKYSLDGGKTWNDGEGTSFNLAQNTTYNSGDIKVYQVDKAGNTSGIHSFAITIQTDNTVEAPAFALNSDTGIADDLITNDNVVNVTLAQDVASWEYSLKGGEWTKGTGTSFNLEDNTSYAVGDIRVRQTDKAGNVSEAASNTLRIIEDSLVEAPTVALLNDTGAPPNDKVTSSATLNVTTTEPGVVVEYTLNGGKNWLSESEYTAAVNHDGEYTVGVRQTDMAGNQSDTSSLAFTLDTTAPTVTNLAINSSSLTFTLGGANGLSPEASQFAVQVNGQDVAITGVSRNGDLVTLTLANPVKANDSVSISSTAQALADAAGNSWTLSQGEVSNTTVPASTLNGVMFFEREELGANDAFNVLHFSGTHLTELLAPNQEVPPSGIDIKNQLDFSKLSWRVQDSIGTVKHVTLSAADILSAKVMNDTSLDITLTPAAMALLGDAGGLLGADDDIFVGAGFLHAANGTAATMTDLQILDINTTYSHTVDANSTPDAIAATNIVINGDGAFNPNLIGQDQILTIEGNGSITMSPLVLNGILINASQEAGGRTTVDVSDNAHHIINNQGQGSLTIGLLGNVDLEVSGTAQIDNVDGSGTLTLTGGNQVLALHSATPSGILQVNNFMTGEDFIALSKTAFGLSEDASNGPVTLTSLQVVNGTAANTADASLIYNQATGALFFDNDGTGSNAAVQLLQLDSGLTLSQGNFNVVIV